MAESKEKTTSYGVLLLAQPGLLFMGHVTGMKIWDIPKGGADNAELPYDAARRETLEETGLVLPTSGLQDLGVLKYRSSKALHLFAARVDPESIDLSKCNCTSYFQHYLTKKDTKEIDAFKWVTFDSIAQHAAKNMIKVLTETLNLKELLNSAPNIEVGQA